MLVREEQDATFLGVGPFQHSSGIGAGTDDPTVATAEGLQVGCGIHVSHRDDVACADKTIEILPGILNAFTVRHIGHGATSGEVRENDFNIWIGQDIGRFGHEVNAAKDDILAAFDACSFLGKFETIAGEISELNHVVGLIMVP